MIKLLPPFIIKWATFSNGHISTTMKSLEVLKLAACSYGLDLSIEHHLLGHWVLDGEKIA